MDLDMLPCWKDIEGEARVVLFEHLGIQPIDLDIQGDVAKDVANHKWSETWFEISEILQLGLFFSVIQVIW